MKPISVDERLPEEWVTLPAYWASRKKWVMADYTEKWGWLPDDDDRGVTNIDVTHYLLPLPPPDSDEWRNQNETDIN